MFAIQNETPFAAALFPLVDPRGVDHVYLVIKATFERSEGKLRVAPAQAPIVPVDEHWADPAMTSVRLAGEAHPSKGATDVLVLGHAYAPEGKPSPRFGASLAVGSLRKVVAVFGDRTWGGGLGGVSPSAPAPVDKVALVFEKAFGGRHDFEKGFLADLRNPVGVGFRGKRSPAEMKGLPLPNFEDPKQPITSPTDLPTPAGFGPIAPGWQPRSSYVGTYDAAWQKTRAPFLPEDFNPRFFQVAPPDQIYQGFLTGGEPVELTNLSEDGVQRFSLPACALKAGVLVAGEVVRPPLALDTLIFEPDAHRFSLVFRGAIPCDKRLLQVERAHVTLRSLSGAA